MKKGEEKRRFVHSNVWALVEQKQKDAKDRNDARCYEHLLGAADMLAGMAVHIANVMDLETTRMREAHDYRTIASNCFATIRGERERFDQIINRRFRLLQGKEE